MLKSASKLSFFSFKLALLHFRTVIPDGLNGSTEVSINDLGGQRFGNFLEVAKS